MYALYTPSNSEGMVICEISFGDGSTSQPNEAMNATYSPFERLSTENKRKIRPIIITAMETYYFYPVSYEKNAQAFHLRKLGAARPF